MAIRKFPLGSNHLATTKPRTLPIVLVLVSCLLVSINCSSLLGKSSLRAKPSSQEQFWRQQHEYQLLTSPKEENLDDFYGQLQNSPLESEPSAKALSSAEGQLAVVQRYNRPVTSYTYGLTPLEKVRLAQQSEVNQLYRRLFHEPKPIEVNGDQNYDFRSIVRPNEDQITSTTNFNSDYDSKLLEIIANSQPSHSDDFNVKFVEPSDNLIEALDLVPQHLSAGNNNDNKLDDLNILDSGIDSRLSELSDDRSTPSFSDDKRSSGESRANFARDSVSRFKQSSQANLTTLLEDETPTIEEQPKAQPLSSTRLDSELKINASESIQNTSTTIETPVRQVESSSRGIVQEDRLNTDKIVTDGQSHSFWRRAYNNVVSYLPFLQQIQILRNPIKNNDVSNSSAVNGNNLSGGTIASANSPTKGHEIVEHSEKKRVDNKSNENHNDHHQNNPQHQQKMSENTKPGVSVHYQRQQPNSNMKLKVVEVQGAKSIRSNDKQQLTNDEDTEEAENRLIVDEFIKPTLSEAVFQSKDDYFNEPNLSKQKVDHLKQSNLVLPFKSKDENFGSQYEEMEESKAQPENLLGKYIYAPTHHYYLNAADFNKALNAASDDGDNDFTVKSSHRPAGLRRLQPGDEIYGSYDALKPIYAAHKDPLMLNKPNDIYFLVMVSSFCAMAMAVVLAAGLFAYRVQQNRKSSTETDYPTYGVVGPNNLSGKNGAIAFGGYFSNGAPALNTFAGKSASAKHLAGSTSGDSGIAGTDKPSKRSSSDQVAGQRLNGADYMVNQNAARMYHYQHQKQQMIISDRASTGRHTSASDLDSEDENDEGNYTVYECPGLASAHEMEIKNPLFNDDQAP